MYMSKNARKEKMPVVVVVSDDWEPRYFDVENQVPCPHDPDGTYESWVKSIREAWKEEGEWRIADEVEVNLKVDSWVADTAKDLELGDVLRAHLFCVRKNPETPDEDTMNVLVLLTLQPAFLRGALQFNQIHHQTNIHTNSL
jgi:hypothetical protein